MAIKKMYKKGGTTSKKMGGMGTGNKIKGTGNLTNVDSKGKVTGATKQLSKKKMGGKKYQMAGARTQNVPAASFLEQPTAQPFSGDPSVQGGNPNEFVAKKGGKRKMANGGVRELRRKQREERRDKRRADRQADKSAVKSLKTSSRKDRKAEPFKDGAGPIVEMSRSERRADRRATNKASRIFKRQERKARRTTNRADKKEDRTERRTLRAKNRQTKKDLVNKKLNTLNQSDSSSNKPAPFIGPKEAPKTDNKTVVKKVETKKVTNHGVTDDMSFSKAFRAGRNSHGGDNGVFTWKGKKYNTNLKKKDAVEKKEKSAYEKAFESAKSSGKPTFIYDGKSYNTKTKDENKASGTKDGPTTDYGKAFAKAKAADKSSFMFNGKSHATNLKGEKSKQKTMTPFQKAYDAATKGKKTTFEHKGKKYKSGYKAPKSELNSFQKSAKRRNENPYMQPKYKKGGMRSIMRRGGKR